jgi:hypothetical protein
MDVLFYQHRGLLLREMPKKGNLGCILKRCVRGMGVSFQKRKLEALQQHSSSLKAAGGLPGESAMLLRSMDLSEEVRQPPHLAACLMILQ